MTRYSNDEYVDIDVHCHAETGKAALLSTDGEEGSAMWVPKSQMTKCPGRDRNGVATMSEWIAKEKGFI